MVFHDDVTAVFPNVYSRYIRGERLTQLVKSFKNAQAISTIYRDGKVACAMLVSDVAVTVFFSEYCSFHNLLELREELSDLESYAV